jgi:1-phosphatidylinositol-4-phosphate 5-kinase
VRNRLIVLFLFLFPFLFISFSSFPSAFSNTIKERLTSGGASGAFFFFSKGEKFIAKSCTMEEMETLKTNAKAYADYMVANKHSYISKIFGIYQLKIYGNYLCFFVMNNLFYNDDGLTMNEKYDIKGSWVSRNAAPPIEGQSVTCSYCEQKFIYQKKMKVARGADNSSRSGRIGSKSFANA